MVKKDILENRRKGIGYIIEAFMAALVILIFVLSNFAQSPGNYDITSSQDKISGNDMMYILQETDHLQSFLKTGRTGSVQSVISGVSGGKMTVSGSISNLPRYRPNIGFYAVSPKRYNETMREVEPTDPCYGDLEEIQRAHEDTSGPILRSNGTLTKFKHRVTIYVADTDSKLAGGFNGQTDYDTIWMDSGNECQFSEEEGPHLVEDIFFWGDRATTWENNYYDLKEIDGDKKQMRLYQADLAKEFEEQMNEPVNEVQIEPTFDMITFKSEIDTYDLVIFHRRETIPSINSNARPLLDYAENDGSIFLMMSLRKNDLKGDFMNETGLNWVNLPRTGSSATYDKPAFRSFSESQTVETYYRAISSSKDISYSPQGKISSGHQYYTTEKQLASVGDSSGTLQNYDTSDWNVEGESMGGSGSPSGVPNGCGNHGSGDFNFTTATGFKEIEVIITQLGNPCQDLYAATPDTDNDGSYNDEETYVEGEIAEIAGKRYSLSADSVTDATFEFRGSKSVELVNYRLEFPDQDVGKFARMNNLSLASGDGNMELATSVIYWLIEKEQGFGPDDSRPTALTQTTGGFKGETYLPYKLYLRWKR